MKALPFTSTPAPARQARRAGLRWSALPLALAFSCGGVALAGSAGTRSAPPRRYASNGNFTASGVYAPGAAGFNLADVSGVAQLDLLPPGVKGLAWIGRCAGADPGFVAQAQQTIHHPKLFGYYLMDDPDPTGRWAPRCRASALRAEADWIHARRPDAAAFVLLMNLSSPRTPCFPAAYRPERSHVDLFGVSPYPCRAGLTTCDETMIDRYVAAALRAGVPSDEVVPVYQTFGGGRWAADALGAYRLPSAAELALMLARWRAFAPTPAFDYAYSWGSQRGDAALDSSAALQAVMAAHNRAGAAARAPADSAPVASGDPAANAC